MNKIEQLDQEILDLFNKRQELLEEYNIESTLLLEQLLSIHHRKKHKDWESHLIKYQRALSERREPVDHPRVVYQGEPGAYSEMAVIDFFGKDVSSKGLYQFEDAFDALRYHEADYAILPIENSSTGAIRQVYDLLSQYECYIVGETTVQVKHNLMVLPEASIDDIDTVYSHEQGLFQCEQFLKQYRHWKQIPQADTAGSAKMIAQLQDPTKAAICSSRAAEIYGLKIIEEEINSSNNNTTRFVVISPKMELREERDKICISITTAHESGSLHDILTIFAVHGLNLVRLESRPIPDHNWEYMFFIEFTGDLLASNMDDVMRELAENVNNIKVFGNFKSNLKEGS